VTVPAPTKALLELEQRGKITIVRLAHGKVNALDVELLQAIADTFGGLENGQPVVFTGAGRAFSAGVDLKRIADGGMDYVRVFRPTLARAVKAVFDHSGPVVAAVNGHAIAGGCVLAAACDIRYMAAGQIGLSEMRVGVPFPAIAFEVIRHIIGPGARRLVLDAQLLRADEALAIGLVDHVAAPESLLDEAIAEAERLAKISPDVYQHTKRLIQKPARQLIEGITQTEEDTATALWGAPQTQAAINGFMASLK
jgi:enoyl-CoA hydratase